MNWYAFQVRVKRRGDERAAMSVLMELGIFARVPVLVETQSPVLPGYVLAQSADIFRDVEQARRRRQSIAGLPVEADKLLARYIVPVHRSLGGAAGRLEAGDMTAIDYIAEHGAAAVDLVTPQNVPAGEMVEITSGPYKGVIARLARWKGSRRGYRMVVELEGMQRVLLVEMLPAMAKAVRQAHYKRSFN